MTIWIVSYFLVGLFLSIIYLFWEIHTNKNEFISLDDSSIKIILGTIIWFPIIFLLLGRAFFATLVWLICKLAGSKQSWLDTFD